MVVELYDFTNTHNMKFYDYGVDYPFNFSLVDVTKDSDARDIFKLVDGWLANMPKGKWPNWVVGEIWF